MKTILHADLDSFFVAVERLDNPELNGKIVVVGGDPDSRSVVAAASYEARAFGIRSAMPMRQAMKLCPDLIRITPRMDRYKEISESVMEEFRDFTPFVEKMSIDEAFLDVSHLVNDSHDPYAVATNLKSRIEMRLGLIISIGVATCKSVAKIASGFDKPDGLYQVLPGKEQDFLFPLSVGMVRSIGPKTEKRLNEVGVYTIEDLASKSPAWCDEFFGKQGQAIRARALGNDEEPIVVERETKSISMEMTFPTDVGALELLNSAIVGLSRELSQRLKREGFKCSTLTIKVRLGSFQTFTRQTAIGESTDDVVVMRSVAEMLLRKTIEAGTEYRLLGLRATHLTVSNEVVEEIPSKSVKISPFRALQLPLLVL
jgi:DNA polymerase-4